MPTSSQPEDILFPNGKPIGIPGSKSSIRELPGGADAAQELFDQLSIGGVPVSVSTYPGKMVDLPAGGRVGFRPISDSGEPTLDIDIEGIPIKKIKFK